MQNGPVKSEGENASRRQEPPRRRYSDGPVANAESILAAAGPFGDEPPMQGRIDPPRRRFSDGPLNRAEALMNQAAGYGDAISSAMSGQPQRTNLGPRRNMSDGHLHQAEAMLSEAADGYGEEPDPQGMAERNQPARRRRSDGPLDQAQAMLAAADGFGAFEPLPHNQFPLNHRGSAPPSTHQPRRRANSDGVIANAESLLAAGFVGPSMDGPDVIEPLPHPQTQTSQRQTLGQCESSELPKPSRQPLRRSNSDGVINQAEAFMAAAAGYNDDLDPQQHFNLQRQGGQMPKRRYSDGPMANAEALLAAEMFEPDSGADQKPPGRGGGGHRRSYSDDPTSNAEAILAATYDQEGAGGGIGVGGSAAAVAQDDNNNLGVEGQLQQLTLMQQMALQGLLTPNQMAALHNLQVQMHLQHSGIGLSPSPQPTTVKSAMKGSSMSPGPAQQQQQQGIDLSGFEPTSIQDMVAPLVHPSQQNAAASSNMTAIDGGVAVGGVAMAMGGAGSIMSQKRDVTQSGKNIGVKSAACASSKKKSWKKPKDKPKRPLSAYNLFFKKERERMVQAAKAADAAAIAAGLKDPNKIERNPSGRRSRKIHGIGFASMAKSIATNWKALGPDDKKEFEERAAVERTRYRKELDEWKKVKREKTLIQQRAELREIQERRRMEEQAALAAHHSGQVAFQLAQMQQMNGQQHIGFHQQMMAGQQQQMGMSLNQAGPLQSQMMQAQQMQGQQMQGQQMHGQQLLMGQQMQGQHMPGTDESSFYVNMFEHLSRDSAGNSANSAAVASGIARNQFNPNQAGSFQGAGVPNPPPATGYIASNVSAQANSPAAERVLSQGVTNNNCGPGDRREIDKMLMQQQLGEGNMCSFQMSDLSSDMAGQDPTARSRR